MSTPPITAPHLDHLIHAIRNQKVILDADLARLYGVSTKALNQAIKRNIKKFPTDFMFQLTIEETKTLCISRSQIVTLKRGKNVKYLPHAFTEHGAIMAANVLHSAQAEKMSVHVVRTFVKMRSFLAEHRELALHLADLEKKLTHRLDIHEAAIVNVLHRIMRLLDPPPEPEPRRRPIGFTPPIGKRHQPPG
ncbi:MAG: ORF6N domain-containing protein [Verrucomicrobiae bacterium]|nr:ORF6N domain-containing protein [Verrucomicrobiae bacterium]